jgi:hypothetical protein
VRAAQ